MKYLANSFSTLSKSQEIHVYISLILYSVGLWIFFFIEHEFRIRALFLLILCCVKDTLVFLIQIKPIKIVSYNREGIFHDYDQRLLGFTYVLAILNRAVFFPFIFLLYLCYLLIQQTQLRDLHITWTYLMLNEGVLLTLTTISGLGLVYKSKIDENWKLEKLSLMKPYFYVFCSIFSGLLTTYIIFQQTFELGFLGAGISFLSGILMYFVGILFLEGDM